MAYLLLADPGKARGCSTNTFVIDSLTDLSNPLVKISLRRRHAQTVRNGASSYKTNYIDMFLEILNHEEHQNLCIGSKITAILLNGWILPTGGASSGRVCACSLRSRLVNTYKYFLRTKQISFDFLKIKTCEERRELVVNMKKDSFNLLSIFTLPPFKKFPSNSNPSPILFFL